MNVLEAWIKYKQFEDLSPTSSNNDSTDSSCDSFLFKFEQLACEAAALGCRYTDPLLAFKLLDKTPGLKESDIKIFLAKLPPYEPKEHEVEVKENVREDDQDKLAPQPNLLEVVKFYLRCLATNYNEDADITNHNQPGQTMTPEGEDIDIDMDLTKAMLGDESISMIEEKMTDGYEMSKVSLPAQKSTAVGHRRQRKPIPKMKDRQYACSCCDFVSNTRARLEQHKLDSHNSFACNKCNSFVTSEKKKLHRHLRAIHDVKLHMCLECDESFTTGHSLLRHKQESHDTDGDSRTHVCEKCGYKAITKTLMKQHQVRVHEKLMRAACDQCPHVAPDRSKLKLHKLTKHEGVTFPCDQCSFVGATPRATKRHKDMYHNLVRYECDKCEYVARDRKGIKFHKENKHEGVRYPCTDCDMKFVTPAILRRHQESIHQRLRFPCDVCGFIATQRAQLSSHIKTKHQEDHG